ncbi:MAG: glutamate--tRNA ligase [Corallococcus sp.]|nr:glutamate--tRNA ligase [Corallococcus sp.]MCM1359087.1 glutamate--tRNA ligase [Corallococcus sp.]MCM1395076.1 glutamate--tRNA ligase [Corallococcus sp.]
MKQLRTRFAPSPTGYLHIGGLRSALYSYLHAKKNNGKFILRIEDTDQGRYVEGAVEIIYRTLRDTGIIWDEGPDVGGDYGPYIQSERKNEYLKYAKQLVESGHAYYCFCSEERLSNLPDVNGARRYDKHCLHLSKEEVAKRLANGESYVIRQNMPTDGSTTYHDVVYGDITIENSELEDQILIKSDGMPTYNFANVVDDHLMDINCVMRGMEYLSSTPKYNLLYDAFGWERPVYIHMPPIMKDAQHKLSKRNGDASYEDLIKKGYLKDAIINYIALLGWSPKDDSEKMSFAELQQKFDVSGINKSPSIFDPVKLAWLNSQYIKEMPAEDFAEYATPWIENCYLKNFDKTLVCKLIQSRVETFGEIEDKLRFLTEFGEFDSALYENLKQKTDADTAREILPLVREKFAQVSVWDNANLYQALVSLAQEKGLKNGKVLWPARIALTGLAATPGGASEIAELLGKEETLKRLDLSIKKLG